MHNLYNCYLYYTLCPKMKNIQFFASPEKKTEIRGFGMTTTMCGQFVRQGSKYLFENDSYRFKG